MMANRFINSLRKNSRGFVLVWTALFIAVGIGAAALAVDLGYAYVISTELKSVADAGALIAASTYLRVQRDAVRQGIDPSTLSRGVISGQIQTAVDAIVARSAVLRSRAVTAEIQYGIYNFNGQPYEEPGGAQFNDQTVNFNAAAIPLNGINAFRVRATRGRNADLAYFFARVMGFVNFAETRESVSILNPRNFVMIIDTSGSMDNISYPPGTPFVMVPPDPGDPSTPWFSPFAPSPTQIAGFVPQRSPEPLQTVLNSSSAFITDLTQNQNTGDSAAVIYFAQTPAIKLPLTDLGTPNVATQFTDLFSNQTLYSNLIPGPDPLDPPHYELRNGVSTFNFATNQYENSGNIAIPNGETNIGGAIDTAMGVIAATPGADRSISVIILFTDGEPTCDQNQCYGSNLNGGQAKSARDYTVARANAAMAGDVLIYPISYGNISNQVRAMMDAIARASGLPNHYAIGSTTDINQIRAALNNIFNDIALLIPFNLVG